MIVFCILWLLLMICLKPFRFRPLVYPWSWPARNKGCVWTHSYCFIPAFACGERRWRVRLLALEGERMLHAGGFPSNPVAVRVRAEHNEIIKWFICKEKRRSFKSAYHKKSLGPEIPILQVSHLQKVRKSNKLFRSANLRIGDLRMCWNF
jgi:hypothetical protein